MAYNGKRMDYHNLYNKVKRWKINTYGLMDNKLFDPIDPLRKHYKDIKKYELASVCEYFDVKINVGRGNHEALWDAMALKRIILKTGDMGLGKPWVKKDTPNNSQFGPTTVPAHRVWGSY